MLDFVEDPCLPYITIKEVIMDPFVIYAALLSFYLKSVVRFFLHEGRDGCSKVAYITLAETLHWSKIGENEDQLVAKASIDTIFPKSVRWWVFVSFYKVGESLSLKSDVWCL